MATALREPYDPFFDVDWSVALRGSYTKATGGEHFDVLLVPTVSLDHLGTRSAINITGSAEIVRPMEGQIDVSALRLGLHERLCARQRHQLSRRVRNLSLTRP